MGSQALPAPTDHAGITNFLFLSIDLPPGTPPDALAFVRDLASTAGRKIVVMTRQGGDYIELVDKAVADFRTFSSEAMQAADGHLTLAVFKKIKELLCPFLFFC